MKNYSEQLKDPRWQKKRLEILNRDEFRCTACGDGHANGSILFVASIHDGDMTFESPGDSIQDSVERLCFGLKKRKVIQVG